MKPLIRFVPGGSVNHWRCGRIGRGWCYGATPLEAYERWMAWDGLFR